MPDETDAKLEIEFKAILKKQNDVAHVIGKIEEFVRTMNYDIEIDSLEISFKPVKESK